MSARAAVALLVSAALVTFHGGPAAAQADAHARALARATCQNGKQSQLVTSATAALEREPDELSLRMRLADALVDQGCYQEAVSVLEAGQEGHPRDRALAGKLRDVRSLVTEQTYIEELTQAAEGAKFQRNQLRCVRLADVQACDDALKFKPDDAQLLLAKSEAAKAKVAAVAALQVPVNASSAPPASAPAPADKSPAVASNTVRRGRSPKRMPGAGTVASSYASSPSDAAATARATMDGAAPSGGQRLTATNGASAAANESSGTRTYSNEAPAGRTN